MIIATKNSTDNTVITESQKKRITSQEQIIADLKLPSESEQALEAIHTDSNLLASSNNIKSMPPLQRYYQQTKLEELIEQKSTMMSPEQIQRLQNCVQQIAAIIYEQTSEKEDKGTRGTRGPLWGLGARGDKGRNRF